MLEHTYPINRDRLSVLVAIILLISVLFRFIELPSNAWELDILGSPLRVQFTNISILIILTVAVVVTGTRFVLRAHPLVPDKLPRPLYLSWVLPGLLAGLVTYAVHQASAVRVWGVGVLLIGLLVSLAVRAEFIALSTEDARYTRARLALNLLAYLLAFFLFYFI
ncbi:MAG: hypothetical protein JXD18_13365, partial [Anaerolineae bacterium]|nr:hypothetical protein [Anaerolineae bacterium]